MEPVVGMREDFDEEIRHVSVTFLAWRQLLANHQPKRMPTFVAYVLEGKRGDAAHAREVLQEAQARVVDVDTPEEREWLLSSIRRVSESGQGQGQLLT